MTWKAGSKKVALRVAGTSTKLSFTAKYTDTVKRVRIVFAPNGGRVSSGSKTVICGKLTEHCRHRPEGDIHLQAGTQQRVAVAGSAAVRL